MIDPMTIDAIVADPSYLILLAFVCFGMICVFATFVFMMPIVANVILGVFSTVMGEQMGAKARGQTSGVITPEILDRDFVDPGPNVKPVGG
jgi:uncharacterized protein involved in cysteine biosynthesis